MGVIFQNRPGAVVRLEDPAIQCTTQLLGLRPDITFESQRSIVTRVTVGQRVNLQFLHTIGALIYVYVFGDRMGQITLSGLSFACECPDGSGIGTERILEWYKDNRASKRRRPALVMLGNSAIEGLVIGNDIDVVDPQTNIAQWTMQLSSLPEEN